MLNYKISLQKLSTEFLDCVIKEYDNTTHDPEDIDSDLMGEIEMHMSKANLIDLRNSIKTGEYNFDTLRQFRAYFSALAYYTYGLVS